MCLGGAQVGHHDVSPSAGGIYHFLKINVLTVSPYYTAVMNRRRKQQGQAVQNQESRPHRPIPGVTGYKLILLMLLGTRGGALKVIEHID